jgi:photosystem II stability/assembly factor-like uncharacterized protein
MIYLGTESGLYRWSQGSPWPVFHSLQNRRIKTVLAGGEGRLTVVDDGGRILESLTNGESWKEIDLPVGAGSATACAIGGSPLTMILATRSMGLYCRAVGTAWWAKLNVPVVDESVKEPTINALGVTPGDSPVLFAAVSGAGLFRTADGGSTWAKVEGVPTEIHVIRATPGVIALGTDQGVWVSTDLGLKFSPSEKGLEAVPEVYSLDINPKDSKWLLAGAAAAKPVAGGVRPQGFQFGLYESKDGGKSWAKVTKRGLPELVAFDTISDIKFDPAEPDCIIMAQGSGECWATQNGGDYWVVISRAIESARSLSASA